MTWMIFFVGVMFGGAVSIVVMCLLVAGREGGV